MQLEESEWDRNNENMKHIMQTFDQKKKREEVAYYIVCMITWVNESCLMYVIKLDMNV